VNWWYRRNPVTLCISAWEKCVFRSNKLSVPIVVCLLALVPAACNEAEQNRPLTYEKGVYGGAEDQKLTEEQRRELRRRGTLQNF